MADFNPFQGVGQSFGQGAQVGLEYAKNKLDVETRQANLQMKQAELEQVKRQRDLDTGKWFMSEVEKIAAKPPGKYKNTLIQNFQSGLDQMGYKNTDALGSLLVDEGYANDLTAAIANYHQMPPEMQQQWLPEISKFINSGDPAEQLKAFAAQSGDIQKIKLTKDLDLRNDLIKENNKKKGEKPEKDLKNASEVRTSLQGSPVFKEYAEVRSNFGLIRDAAEKGTPFRDLGALYAFMKMLDPNSVVRESEGQLFIKTGSAYEGIASTLTKLYNGETLSPKKRNELFDIASGRVKDFKDRYEDFSKDFLDEAERAGVTRKAADPGARFIEEDNKNLERYAINKKASQRIEEARINQNIKNKVPGYDSETLAMIAKFKSKGYGRKKIEALVGKPIPEDLANKFGLE